MIEKNIYFSTKKYFHKKMFIIPPSLSNKYTFFIKKYYKEVKKNDGTFLRF